MYAKSVKNAAPVSKNRPPKKPVIARNGKRVDDWRIVEARMEKSEIERRPTKNENRVQTTTKKKPRRKQNNEY